MQAPPSHPTASKQSKTGSDDYKLRKARKKMSNINTINGHIGIDS